MSTLGDALEEAREARGLSAIELAAQIDVRRETIHKWERGVTEPSAAYFDQLLRVLDLPAKFFHMPAPPPSLAPIFYRSLRSVRSAAQVKTAQRRLGWLREIVAGIERFVELPQLSLVKFDAPSDPADLSASMIEQQAQELRRLWRLGDGAISGMPWLMDNAGIVISRNHLEIAAIDAFSHYGFREARPIVILANDGASPARTQADCAHELGHLVLHRYVDKRYAFDRERYRIMEDQAWHFARAFLLPAKTFRDSVDAISLDHFAQLKLSWFVSIALMIRRAQDVGLIDKTVAQHLWIKLQNRKWKKVEPYDDRIIVERPRLLREAAEAIVAAGSSYVRPWLNNMRIGPKEIASFVDIDVQELIRAEREPPRKPTLKDVAQLETA